MPNDDVVRALIRNGAVVLLHDASDLLEIDFRSRQYRHVHHGGPSELRLHDPCSHFSAESRNFEHKSITHCWALRCCDVRASTRAQIRLHRIRQSRRCAASSVGWLSSELRGNQSFPAEPQCGKLAHRTTYADKLCIIANMKNCTHEIFVDEEL